MAQFAVLATGELQDGVRGDTQASDGVNVEFQRLGPGNRADDRRRVAGGRERADR
jgi:hypothetical protein